MQKQAIASMSQTQYDAIIDMSKNDGVNKPFETINQPVHSEQTKR